MSFARLVGRLRRSGSGRKNHPYGKDRQLLASVADYVGIWVVLVGAPLLAVWVVGGGFLLQRAIQPDVSRRQGRLGRCCLISFLNVVAGVVAGGITMFLVDTIDKRIGPDLRWATLVAGLLGFLAVTVVVLYASFEFSFRRTARLWGRAYLGVLVLALLVTAPVGWYVYKSRQTMVARGYSAVQLQRLYKAVVRCGRGMAPDTLSWLVERNDLNNQDLQCYRNRGRAVDFFYQKRTILSPTEASREVFACDFIDNHGGTGRVVILTNGEAGWYDADKLPELLKLPENQDFAEALAEAEKAMKLGP